MSRGLIKFKCSCGIQFAPEGVTQAELDHGEPLARCPATGLFNVDHDFVQVYAIGSRPVPAGWSCVRCGGGGLYCANCGCHECVEPDGCRGSLVICDHRDGALKVKNGTSSPDADHGLEKVVKSNPAWIKLWARTKLTPATAPGIGSVADSIHGAMSLDPRLLREAFHEAWRAGRQAGLRS